MKLDCEGIIVEDFFGNEIVKTVKKKYESLVRVMSSSVDGV